MKTNVILTVCLLMLSQTMTAQEEVLARINEIKLDSTYLYGEATLQTTQAAYSMSNELLMKEVKDWIKKSTTKQSPLAAEDLSNIMDSVVLPRLSMFRVFTYVKKSDLISILKEAGFNVEQTKSSEPSIVMVDNPYSTTEHPTTITPNEVEELSPVLQKIIGAKTFFELKDIIEPLYANGLVSKYGKYATMSQPADSYLIIYNTSGDIVAYLGKGTEKRKNLSTQKPDSEHNYSGCGAIWFQLKD